MNDKMRAEFEEWAKRTLGGDNRTNELGEYTNEDWEYPWWAWQASRAALVVELPESRTLSASDDPWAVRDWCKDAIEAAGVRVKP